MGGRRGGTRTPNPRFWSPAHNMSKPDKTGRHAVNNYPITFYYSPLSYIVLDTLGNKQAG